MSLYLSAIGIISALLTALVIASWLIVRDGQAIRKYDNLERLVLLDHQTLQSELLAIRNEVTSVASTTDAAKQSLATLANALVHAMREIDLRLERLNNRTGNFSPVIDDQHSKLKASDIVQLRYSIDKLIRTQKLTEERLSDEIRFNLDRAKVIDGSLKGIGIRMEELSDRFNNLRLDLSDSSNSVTSGRDCVASEANRPQIVRGAQQVDEENEYPVDARQARIENDPTLTAPLNDEAA